MIKTATYNCLVLFPLLIVLSLVILSDCQKVLGDPLNFPGEPGYYDGSDIARPYLVDYSTGSPVYTYFDKEEYYPPSNHHKRGATSHKDHLWPLGIIPFSIDANFSDSEREQIFDALRHWEESTCIRFYPLSTYNSTSGVNFHNSITPICNSFVGRMGDYIQQIYLSSVCGYPTILHEIGHTVGFWHEQNRPDRDQYIIIHMENIRPDRLHLFEIETEIDSLGETYDFNSIMHYREDLFSIGDTIAISSKEEGIPVGRGPGLSSLDIKQTSLLYKDQCSLRSSSESRLLPKVSPPSPVNLFSWNCSEHLIGTSGQFSPPDDPYKSNTDCVWAIEAPEGHGIQLKIDGIDLRCDNSSGIYIYLHHDIRKLEDADIMLCNNNTSGSYNYSTNLQYIYVRFHTNAEGNAQNMKGFSTAEFTSYDIDECELYEFCDQGCVNLNGSYECTCKEGYYWTGGFGFGCFDVNECGFDNGNCSHTCINMGGTYRCECPVGYVLQPNKLDCVDVDECLSDNGGCDHICMNTEGSYECLCNTSYILAADNKSCVTPSHCNSYTVLRKHKGHIGTVGFPASHYAPNSNCTWVIISPAEYESVLLKFRGMSIERSDDCAKDRLTILNGRYNPVMIGSYCGNQLPATVQSSTRTVTINFISDGSVSDKGFSLSYKGLKRRIRGARKCNIVLNKNSSLTLATFPLKYRTPVNCTYSLVAPQNMENRIKITLLYLDIQDADCSMDRIEIYNGTDVTPSNKMAEICSGTYETEYYSGRQDMTMRYIGNTLRRYRGFHASVTFY